MNLEFALLVISNLLTFGFLIYFICQNKKITGHLIDSRLVQSKLTNEIKSIQREMSDKKFQYQMVQDLFERYRESMDGILLGLVSGRKLAYAKEQIKDIDENILRAMGLIENAAYRLADDTEL